MSLPVKAAMIEATFRPVQESDILDMSARARAMDKLECELILGTDIETGLRKSLETSAWAYSCEVGGKLQTIFGVSPNDTSLLRFEAAPWMVGVEGVEKCARQLIVLSKPYIARMAAEYERLFNVVHADNASAIRWLKRLGFSFGPPVTIAKAPFLPFEMTGNF